MTMLQNANAIESGGYNVTNSLRFRSSASAYLNRTPASASNRKTWTYSVWVKRGTLGVVQEILGSNGSTDATNFAIEFNSSDQLYIGVYSNVVLLSTQVFRDPSAWYHIVIALDTTQATASNRCKVYINNVQITSWATDSSATYFTLNSDQGINNNTIHNIGRNPVLAARYFDGYTTEMNLIDGQQLTPSSFGETDTTTGVWKPKAYTGTYGTNGFYLKFADASAATAAAIGKDSSGNGNNWTPSGISVTAGTTYDAMTDSPTLTSATVANYAVISPIDVSSVGATISNGNLKFNNGNAGAQSTARATIGVSSGKYYWETTCTTFGSANPDTGILGTNSSLSSADQYVGNYALGYSYGGNGQKRNNNSGSAYGSSYTSGDVIGVALDMDAGTLTFYKNNASQGTAFTGLSGTFSPAISGYNGVVWDVNFGQRPFTYTPPTGFVRLNTFNLPTPTILQGSSYMNALLYTGNGSTQTVTGLGFTPGMLWIKDRSAITNHQVNDEVRGVGRELQPDATSAETNNNIVTAFNSNGFSISSNGNVNANGNSYVAWTWKANGAGSSNTSGSITSTVSVNTTAGFSIVTYTGTGANATVGHGLGVAPSFTAVKCRNDGTIGWVNYHANLGNTKFLNLNSTNAAGTGSTVWNNTSPTSTTIALGTDSAVNGSTKTYVIYAWAEIAGFSKFGSYTGNGSADGPFVYLGFRPEFVMVKRSDSGNNWVIEDSSRSSSNVVDKYLAADDPQAESTSSQVNIDFLSNGFKLRSAFDIVNAGTYIYMAFAENPFKNSLAR